MTPGTIGFIGLGFLVLLVLSRLPVAVAMALTGFFGYAYIQGFPRALSALMILPYTTFSSFSLSLIPLFILMGFTLYYAGLGRDLYDTAHTWVGQFRGGLAMASVGACALFAAVEGSGTATQASMAKVAVPEMRRYGYAPGLATATIAAGGALGILIPPSIILCVYGLMVYESIAKLLVAGILPGITAALTHMAIIYVVCTINPSKGPKGPKTGLREKLVSLRFVWPVLVLFTLVMGGLFIGFFTPTEGGAVGAFGALAIMLGMRRLSWQVLKDSLTESVRVTAMILFIVVGAMIFGQFIAVTRLPQEIIALFKGLGWSNYAVMATIIGFYLVIGCFMEGMSFMILTVPLFAPLVTDLGFSLIWFGIIMVRMIEVGAITPPVGLAFVTIKAIVQDVSLKTMFKGGLPFVISDIINTALLLAFPAIVLFLPSLM
ncbi:TRAP transporter large permease [Chloroflexota bacterium]